MMVDILEKIKSYKLQEIIVDKVERPVAYLEEQVYQRAPPRGFESALRKKQKTSYAVIAEIKKASPSKGIIRTDFNVGKIARDYETGGACCLSVLTDAVSFMGKKGYIQEAINTSKLPILRKDFLYDPYQVLETRAIGADCILIIMASVSDQQAQELEESALFWGLDVLIEVHNYYELERALKLKSKMIGINNRNLKTFNVDLQTTLELATNIPNGYLVISESGLNTKNDLAKMAEVNVKSFLVGESLMREKNIKKAIEKLLG